MPEDKANAALNNPQMKKFFSAQPFFVQECIMQTGVETKASRPAWGQAPKPS